MKSKLISISAAVKNQTDLRQNLLIYLTSSWVIIEALYLFVQRYNIRVIYFDVTVGLVIAGLLYLLVHTWRQLKIVVPRGNSDKIKVLIVDDHKMIRDVLKSYLEYDRYEVAGESANGIEALEFMKGNKIDIVLTDIDMPKMDGIELSRTISSQYPAVRTICVTMQNESHKIKDMLKAGSSGYLLKDDGDDLVRKAIETVFQGGNYYSSSVTNTIFSSFATS